MRLIPVLLALAGCTQYAKIARTNAPGVVDISTPVARENGSDELYEAPVSDKPTNNAYVVWLHPSFGGGLIRRGAGIELGVGVSIEKNSGEPGSFPLQRNAWGISAGMGIVQHYDDQMTERTDAPGPIAVEAYYRKFIVSFGAGPLVYPDTRDVGAQITIRAPLTHVRLRYAQDSGFEAMLAYDFNFPLVFGWSR